MKLFFMSFWLLPIFFMAHDFEELVFVPTWLSKHDARLGKRKLFGGVNRSDILSLGIWEEFILYVIVVIISYLNNWKLFFVGAGIIFAIHLAIHILLPLFKHSYVPGFFTSIIELPIIASYLGAILLQTQWRVMELFVMIICNLFLFAINLMFVHFLMSKLQLKLAH